VQGDRRLRILTRLVESLDGDRQVQPLCEVCAEITATTGAGLMLMFNGVSPGSFCTTDAVSARLEQLHLDLGEGPWVDAYDHDRAVLEPDLAAQGRARWVAFTSPAVDAGARAIFGFPLLIGAVRLGAMGMYSDRPGVLSYEQHADALVMADVAARAILLLQANAPAGTIASELAAATDLQFEVHQAAGMVAAQLDITVGEALIRLRANAFGNERSLDEVARDVVARRLRFEHPGRDRPAAGGKER
jgi:hypothetical protein